MECVKIKLLLAGEPFGRKLAVRMRNTRKVKMACKRGIGIDTFGLYDTSHIQ